MYKNNIPVCDFYGCIKIIHPYKSQTVFEFRLTLNVESFKNVCTINKIKSKR